MHSRQRYKSRKKLGVEQGVPEKAPVKRDAAPHLKPKRDVTSCQCCKCIISSTKQDAVAEERLK